MRNVISPIWLKVTGGLCILVGCSSFSLDPYLNKAIGKKLNEISYPELKYGRVIGYDGPTETIEYSIDTLYRCIWVFEIDRVSGNIIREGLKNCSAV